MTFRRSDIIEPHTAQEISSFSRRMVESKYRSRERERDRYFDTIMRQEEEKICLEPFKVKFRIPERICLLDIKVSIDRDSLFG